MLLTDPRHLAFWAAARAARPDLSPKLLRHAGPFDDNADGAAFCAKAVLEGRKTATSALASTSRDYLAGELELVTELDGTPVALIEITGADLASFGAIDAGFAEAEGDGTLEAWRQTHKRFYGARLAEQGVSLTDETLLRRISFRRVFPV